MQSQPLYNLYPTLIDGFAGYLNSSEIYQEYWGFSEDPSKSEEEFEQEQLQSLIDRINRVPFESEAADRGTAFNEIVDCIILNRTSDKMELKSEDDYITALYKGNTFTFPKSLCREFAGYFKGATPQVYTDAMLATKYGPVYLYGYIDELMPQSVHDIKTTGKYKAGKFRNNWQHIVYPYCLNASGNKVTDFEYNIAVFSKTGYSTFTEHYAYNHERDTYKLKGIVERFIEFLESHREVITDNKIFNLQTA